MPHLPCSMRSRSSGRSWPVSARSSPKSCSFSLRGVYEELSRVLIKATSGNAGLFLLVDDLHAADPDTLYFLNYLFRKLRHVPVLVAATIQEEQLGDYPELADLMAEWSAAGHVTVTVVPLERAHVGEYVRMMSAAGERPMSPSSTACSG